MLFIKNAMIADPVREVLYRADLLIEKDKIKKIFQEGESCPEEAAEEVIDASAKIVAPGLIDAHVHFRDPGFPQKEDIFSGAEAAKKGGYTGIVLMANTKPCVDNEDTLTYVLEKGRKTGIKIETCANVTKGMKGKEITDMEKLAFAGACGFTDDGIPLLEEALVKEAMIRSKAVGKPISFHEENPALITNNGIHAGKAAAFFGIGGSPREAEIDLVRRDLALALETGAEITIQHISTKEAVDLVRQAKKKGKHIHAEATPHHFTLTQEAVIEKGSMAKMNPPLREEEDRLAIVEGLIDGTIDMIATDHAPHTREEKAREITRAPSGIIGLETALSLGIWELVNKGFLSIPQLIYKMSTAAADLYGLSGGRIAEGQDADLVIFDPEESYIVKEFASKSDNSPFIGEKLPGVVYATICRGKIVYRRNES